MMWPPLGRFGDTSLLMPRDEWRGYPREYRQGDPRKGTASIMRNFGAGSCMYPVTLVDRLPYGPDGWDVVTVVSGPGGNVCCLMWRAPYQWAQRWGLWHVGSDPSDVRAMPSLSDAVETARAEVTGARP